MVWLFLYKKWAEPLIIKENKTEIEQISAKFAKRFTYLIFIFMILFILVPTITSLLNIPDQFSGKICPSLLDLFR